MSCNKNVSYLKGPTRCDCSNYVTILTVDKNNDLSKQLAKCKSGLRTESYVQTCKSII